MVWQKIDDQFGVSKKVTRIPRKHRLAAVGLWELASNYSVRALTDGVLDENELDDVMATPALISLLVGVGLWHTETHSCPRCVVPPTGGVVIHDFLEYNPDASSVDAGRDEKSEGGKHGNHIRWHLNRRITDPKCDWCAIASGSLRNPPGPVPGPVPDDLTDMGDETQSSPVVTAGTEGLDEVSEIVIQKARNAGVRDIRKLYPILARTIQGPLSASAAVELAQVIAERSQHPVKDVDAYVATACRKSPEDVQHWYDTCDLGVA
jgi:hypothetical protein